MNPACSPDISQISPSGFKASINTSCLFLYNCPGLIQVAFIISFFNKVLHDRLIHF